MRVLDKIILAVYIIAMVILFFLKGCGLEMIMLLVAGIVTIGAIIAMVIQSKKRKDKVEA